MCLPVSRKRWNMSRMREGGPNESLISAVWRLGIRVNRICLSLLILADIYPLPMRTRFRLHPSVWANTKLLLFHLVSRAAGQAIQDADVTSSEITHLITVSCTGQFLPGLDVRLIQQLELSPQINRIPLVFQGCAAGLKAIQLANSIVTTDQKATVLIVCVELCTLHFQPSAKRDDLYAASFFGDGASACVIGASGTDRNECFRLGRGHSTLLPDCAEEMIWEVGNTGFDLYLSPQIPKLLGLHLGPEIERLLEGSGLPEIWAIHPGGRGIVDAVQKLYQLTDEQVSYSRNILRDYGNLSSVTILFVLQAIREDYRQKEEHSSGIALAFGPGLTAELLPLHTSLPP